MVWWYDSKLPGPIQIPYFSGYHYTNMYQAQGSEVLGWALDRKTSSLTLTLDLWFFVKNQQWSSTLYGQQLCQVLQLSYKQVFIFYWFIANIIENICL